MMGGWLVIAPLIQNPNGAVALTSGFRTEGLIIIRLTRCKICNDLRTKQVLYCPHITLPQIMYQLYQLPIWIEVTLPKIATVS
jgi:hypothetical protein